MYRKKIHDKLEATLPTSIAVHIPSVPSAPPPYICAQSTFQHGDDQHPAAVKTLAKQTSKEGEKYQLILFS